MYLSDINSSLYCMKDIAIFGAGGFGREVACLIRMINETNSDKQDQWNFIGFFDEYHPVGFHNEYGEVLGNLDVLNKYDRELGIAIAIGSPDAIKRISEKINNPNIYFPNLIAPNTIFLDKENISLGQGNIICGRCSLSCNVSIGNFNIFNGYIPLGHDTKIGNFNVIMPSVNISGGIQIGDGNFIGVQSVLLQQIRIGNNVRIGANSVVIRNTKDNHLYMGNPAVIVKF